MTLSGREKNALHSIISETSGGLSFAVGKCRSQGTGDNYNDDIYVCGLVITITMTFTFVSLLTLFMLAGSCRER